VEAKNAESIRGAGLRGQRGQAVCDEAVRMVNLARRCGTLRLRNAGFSDYAFITASLFKLVLSLQTGRSAQLFQRPRKFQPKIWLAHSLPGLILAARILRFPDPQLVGGEFAGITVEIKRRQLNRFLSLLFAFVGFGGGADACEAEQDNKYARRCAHEFLKIVYECRAPAAFSCRDCRRRVWPRCWITGHRRGDRRDDFVAVMKPHEAAPDSARLPAAKGGIGPPIRSPQ
jgi:hypothetical protein